MVFVRPDVNIVVGQVVLVVTFILHVVALFTPGWFSLRLGQKGDAIVGLWEYCYEQPKFTCEDLDTQWVVEAWIEACRAFGILAMLTLMTCMMMSFLLCCMRHVSIFFAIVPWTALVSAMLIFIQLAIFAGEVQKRKHTMGQKFKYNYSFIITVVTCVLALIAALYFFIGESRHAAKRSLKPVP